MSASREKHHAGSHCGADSADESLTAHIASSPCPAEPVLQRDGEQPNMADHHDSQYGYRLRACSLDEAKAAVYFSAATAQIHFGQTSRASREGSSLP